MSLSVSVKATVTEPTRHCHQLTPDTKSNTQWKPHLRGGTTQHHWTPDMFAALRWWSYLKEQIWTVKLVLRAAASEVASSASSTCRAPSGRHGTAGHPLQWCLGTAALLPEHSLCWPPPLPVLDKKSRDTVVQCRAHATLGNRRHPLLCEDTWLCLPLPPTQRAQEHSVLQYFKHAVSSHYILLSCKGKP